MFKNLAFSFMFFSFFAHCGLTDSYKLWAQCKNGQWTYLETKENGDKDVPTVMGDPRKYVWENVIEVCGGKVENILFISADQSRIPTDRGPSKCLGSYDDRVCPAQDQKEAMALEKSVKPGENPIVGEEGKEAPEDVPPSDQGKKSHDAQPVEFEDDPSAINNVSKDIPPMEQEILTPDPDDELTLSGMKDEGVTLDGQEDITSHDPERLAMDDGTPLPESITPEAYDRSADALEGDLQENQAFSSPPTVMDYPPLSTPDLEAKLDKDERKKKEIRNLKKRGSTMKTNHFKNKSVKNRGKNKGRTGRT